MKEVSGSLGGGKAELAEARRAFGESEAAIEEARAMRNKERDQHLADTAE